MKDLFFYLGFGTLFTHELDSMLNHEWRVIPLIRALPDEAGQIVFTMAHIPMFAIILALVSSENSKTRKMARIGVGLFLIIHGLLHILFKGHPAYEFSGILSNVLIFAGSFFGVVYLALE
ncbi:hypothetical protein DWB85_18505 [Seongchinamella sediminis]|uniref:Uncharacterized protein n=1 Tax=Seongchinamella sediminis TaxID=2283635 RepID=A0A3L7DUS2_9GAMM|nr:DUF6713 family protein [Seongchinamella sediminis]RLQ20259.1 hypothetical protein DWB85_18505 [Seongchinamella sediminis]